MAPPVISETEAVRLVRLNPGAYVLWLGAGASREAGLATADEISQRIRDELIRDLGDEIRNDPTRMAAWANETLRWSDPTRRYTTCIRALHPLAAHRLRYFRELLSRNSDPAFSHHAAALLMRFNVVRNTCLTTNFDHLIENAFTVQGLTEVQAIRGDEEVLFWDGEDRNRYFVLKLHGDIDTQNILNTQDETIRISDRMARAAESVLSNAGLIVLGAAGHEISVRSLLHNLEQRARTESNFLNFGVLWGVYMGPRWVEYESAGELRAAVERRIRETAISQEVVELMERNQQHLFAFFPVWGAGNFLRRVVSSTGNRALEGTAARYLDHDMRLRRLFAGAGLTEQTVESHLDSLDRRRRALLTSSDVPSRETRPIGTGTVPGSRVVLRLLYGDISSRSLLGSDRFGGGRRAVVSAEDVYLSAGGGVALTLLRKAGAGAMLHELSKFDRPIPQGSVAVTSGGNLPVHYIFHTAALRIEEGPKYIVSASDVHSAITNALDLMAALAVELLWVPLLGTGVGGLAATDSLEGIVTATRDWAAANADAAGEARTLAITIWDDSQLSRETAARTVRAVLGNDAYADERVAVGVTASA